MSPVILNGLFVMFFALYRRPEDSHSPKRGAAAQAGRLPLPLIVKLEMQDTYGGRNFPKVRDVYLQVTSFF